MIQLVCNSAEHFDWLTAAVGFAGVLVGGIIAYLTTARFERQRLKRENKALAYRAIFDVARIADDVTKLLSHVRDVGAKTTDARSRGIGIAAIQGLRREPISFSSDTLGLVADMRKPELVQSMMEVENGHQIVMQSFGKLMDLRDQIGYSGLADVSGDTLSFDLSKTETKAIAPAIIEIGTLAKQIENMLPDLCEEATCLRLKLGPELKAHYHFIHFVTFEPR